MLKTDPRGPGSPRRAGDTDASPSADRLRAAVCLAVAFAICILSATAATDAADLPCRQVLPDSRLHVAWVRPSAARDRDRLDRWCDAVGPLLVEPMPRAMPQGADRLVVIVWNIHVGGGDVDRLIDSLTRGDFTGGTPVSSFVLLLQGRSGIAR